MTPNPLEQHPVDHASQDAQNAKLAAVNARIEDATNTLIKRMDVKSQELEKKINDLFLIDQSSQGVHEANLTAVNTRIDDASSALNKRIEDKSHELDERMSDASQQSSRQLQSIAVVIAVVTFIGSGFNFLGYRSQEKDIHTRLDSQEKDMNARINLLQGEINKNIEIMRSEADKFNAKIKHYDEEIQNNSKTGEHLIARQKEVATVYKSYLLNSIKEDFREHLHELTVELLPNVAAIGKLSAHNSALKKLMTLLESREIGDESDRIKAGRLQLVGEAIVVSYYEKKDHSGETLIAPLHRTIDRWLEVKKHIEEHKLPLDDKDREFFQTDLLAYSLNAAAVTELTLHGIEKNEKARMNCLTRATRLIDQVLGDGDQNQGIKREFAAPHISRGVIAKRRYFANSIASPKEAENAIVSTLTAVEQDLDDAAMYAEGNISVILLIGNNRIDMRVNVARFYLSYWEKNPEATIISDSLRKAGEKLDQAQTELNTMRLLFEKNPVLLITQAELIASQMKKTKIENQNAKTKSVDPKEDFNRKASEKFEEVKNLFLKAREFGYKWRENRMGFLRYLDEQTDLSVFAGYAGGKDYKEELLAAAGVR